MILGVENHTIPILQKNFVDINKTLNLEHIDAFFKGLLSMNANEVHKKESPKYLPESGIQGEKIKLSLELSLLKQLDGSE